MGVINVTNITDGSSIDAADVNNQINTIVNEFNGNIENANIKSGAAITGSKIADASIDVGAKASVWDGWVPVSDAWTYASATTITVPSDATTKYSVGDRIKLVQSATTKYFYITGVAATTLTITAGSSYTLGAVAISNVYYSKAATPLGFPGEFSWTISWSNLTAGSGTYTYSKFSMIGKRVSFRFRFVLSSSTVGTGPAFSYPITSASDYQAGDALSGRVILLDSGTARFTGLLYAASSTTCEVRPENASGTYLAVTGQASSSVPHTWANTDVIQASGEYMAE